MDNLARYSCFCRSWLFILRVGICVYLRMIFYSTLYAALDSCART